MYKDKNGNVVAGSFDGQDAINLFNQYVNSGSKKSEEEIQQMYEFAKSEENDGNGGGGDPFVGKKVLEAKTSTLGKLWATLEPRTWTSPYNVVYNVDANGVVIAVRPLGGIGVLGFVNGGGMNYITYSSKTLQSLISTEKGAQSTQKVNEIIKAMNKNDYSIYAEPIYIYRYKGKQYILDGHHRIEAAIKTNKSLEVIQLNSEKAMILFKNKVQEIYKGLH